MLKITTLSAVALAGGLSLTAFGDNTGTTGVTKSTTTPTNPQAVFQCTVDGVVTTRTTQVDCEEAGGKWSRSLNPTKPNIDKSVDKTEEPTTPAPVEATDE